VNTTSTPPIATLRDYTSLGWVAVVDICDDLGGDFNDERIRIDALRRGTEMMYEFFAAFRVG
jgi:hypothetical protein